MDGKAGAIVGGVGWLDDWRVPEAGEGNPLGGAGLETAEERERTTKKAETTIKTLKNAKAAKRGT